ncbi:Zinc phosphodiesterase [Wickerhamomyces ciferrii]|uniref:ribonuclease Z n=1 Tax=Wickerhamomyces ciferrii (strain ATCC 14091 / BCRC 22168 / CBS 111 / JCM 3599 / NBRC 0793 / NRRL Y-1031 F-60-10) TaxID=1206466 RepID=K0KNQ0_WICCF|nr:Zinc phosphodiesterase [Wickerhamomyces ciferrii]CCH43024.1 Zinc phosphodiesterase [Wickerhamomyces ciferrii]
MYSFITNTYPTSDTAGTSIHLVAPSGEKFIFGSIPEGAQRSVTQQKLKISKLSSIFLTGNLNWKTVGGLPGLILTTSDQGKKSISVLNGNGILNYMISTWRYFVFRFGMDLRPAVLSDEGSYENEYMVVKPVNLSKHNASPYMSDTNQEEKLKAIIRNMFPLDTQRPTDPEEERGDPSSNDPHVHVGLPEINADQVSTCYTIQFKPVRGKFQIDKAKELGIPKGKLFAQLASGKEITLENGTVIRPDQVLSEPRHFQPILIIDIPSMEYLESALSNRWPENTGYVYHLLGKDIDISDETYAKFIESFGPNCQHSISHPLYCPDSVVFESSAIAVLKLKALMKDNYNLPLSSAATHQLPDYKNTDVVNIGHTVTVESKHENKANTIKALKSDTDNYGEDYWQKLYTEHVEALNLNTTSTKEKVLNFKNVSGQDFNPTLSLKDNVETITFGTGSALPSKYRNVISNLVRIPYKDESGVKFRSVLLDAGENTIGSLQRYLGNDLESYMKELKLIYLSHLHADHHLGIVSIIKKWFKMNTGSNEKLYLVTPWQYDHFIKEWFKLENDYDISDRVVYISCEQFLRGKRRNEVPQIPFEDFVPGGSYKIQENLQLSRDTTKIDTMFNDVGIQSFATCRAYHCEWAYSCSITLKLDESKNDEDDLFKVSYSGDTRPNTYMFPTVIGQGSDLLIHEATLENELVQEAKKKRHCTMNEAIEVSNHMKAKKLILTHFSQRYPKLPQIDENISVDAKFCYAFDSMIVKYHEIEDQEKVFKDLDKAFSTEKEQESEEVE